MSLEYPDLGVLSPVEGHDHDDESQTLMMRLLADHSDLIGIYNVGAGVPGVAKAITDAGPESAITFVGHDLSNVTRRCLLRGVMDAVVAQDPGHETRSAMRVLLALVRGEPILAEQERIRIDIVMRDNLP
jgi:LacI family transcriptional regulator